MNIHIETNKLKTLISSEVRDGVKGRYDESSCCIGEIDGIVVYVTFKTIEVAYGDDGYSSEHNCGYVKEKGNDE